MFGGRCKKLGKYIVQYSSTYGEHDYLVMRLYTIGPGASKPKSPPFSLPNPVLGISILRIG